MNLHAESGRARANRSSTIALFLLSLVLVGQLLAEEPTSPGSALSNAVNKAATPPLPSGKSPVDLFRELLAQSPSERNEFLKSRSPASQKLILSKLHEYEALSPEERDLRLRVTEIRWYLVPLMKTPAANRGDVVQTIPERLRGLLEARLQQWDKLPPEVQQQVLANEDILGYYVEQTTKSEITPPEPPVNLAPVQRVMLEKAIRQWQALSEEQRQKIRTSFDQVLELTPEQKSIIFGSLSESDRRQLELTLRGLEKLTPVQRSECLQSFEKLASLNTEGRQEFFRSAELWQQMTPTERKSWKDLLTKLSRLPPVPPGLGFPPVPGALLRSMNQAASSQSAASQTN